jgi:hypothetical protein
MFIPLSQISEFEGGCGPPEIYPFTEKVIFLRLLKNAPACAEASAGRQISETD